MLLLFATAYVRRQVSQGSRYRGGLMHELIPPDPP